MAGEIILKTSYLEKNILYTGQQLRSHWILEQTRQMGDSIVCFEGGADVTLEHMVDYEDVLEKAPIYSKQMLHFIVEHFDCDLERMVLRQRLLVALMRDLLNKPECQRKGDDLYIDGNKLTVSIATSSPVSCLIHTGINIVSKGTPVPTIGLDDLNIHVHSYGERVLEAYQKEMTSVRRARCKVRAVE